MNKIIFFTLILSVTLLFFPNLSGAEEGALGSLTVEVSGVKVEQGGELIFALYKGQDNWLRKGKVFTGRVVSVKEKVTTVNFTNIPISSEYALFVYHDQNKNSKLDFRKFPFPRPREGLAVSNNAVRMGEPRYEKARFSVSGKNTAMNVKMHY